MIRTEATENFRTVDIPLVVDTPNDPEFFREFARRACHMLI